MGALLVMAGLIVHVFGGRLILLLGKTDDAAEK